MALVFVTSCANYASRIRAPRDAFERGQYDLAIEDLKKLVDKNDKDLLLYLMDLGVVYHTAGRYEEAIQTFLKAEKEAEIKDYTSISQEVASVVWSDEAKPYKGEHFENILINVYLAIDYLMLKKWDEALVECRRVNHKLDRMMKEGKLPYDHNAFAKYLAAAIFESQHEYNDAFVDYRQLVKWAGKYPYLGPPLLRIADKLKAQQEYDEYKKKFPEVKNHRLGTGEGEVVLILEQGKVPYKMPNPSFYLIPMFVKNSYNSEYVWLRDKDGKYKARTYPLFDIETTAIKELETRTGGIIAKKIAGIAAKEAVGYAVAEATDSKALGAITAIALRLSDSADLRSWTTLPAKLHIARLSLPSGRRELVIDMVGKNGEVKGLKVFPDVEVKPGRITFLSYRTPD